MNSVTDVGSVAGTSMASWECVSVPAPSVYVGIGAGLGTATSSMYGGTISEDGMQASLPHSFIGTQDLFDTDGRTSAATGGSFAGGTSLQPPAIPMHQSRPFQHAMPAGSSCSSDQTTPFGWPPIAKESVFFLVATVIRGEGVRPGFA